MAAAVALQDPAPPPTLSTSYLAAEQTGAWRPGNVHWEVGTNAPGSSHDREWQDFDNRLTSAGLNSTGKGILIGMLSAFGSAAFVALILAVVYFFRFTSRGRIFLDRIGRPGEFDDEQAFLREEEEALEEMDDLQRAEYMRAKGEVARIYLLEIYADRMTR